MCQRDPGPTDRISRMFGVWRLQHYIELSFYRERFSDAHKVLETSCLAVVG